MKIVLAGGGTGGHFYPIVAVVEKLNKIAQEKKILELKLYYFSDSPYDQTALFDNDIEFEEINSGKMRTYFSIKNCAYLLLFMNRIRCPGELIFLLAVLPDGWRFLLPKRRNFFQKIKQLGWGIPYAKM